jgi:hypothetical protein
MMLHEYDFTTGHIANTKHSSTHMLSRFPRHRTFDASGTQLDADVAAYYGGWTPYPAARKMREGRHKRPPPSLGHPAVTIDTIAPKFGDVFDKGSIHVD